MTDPPPISQRPDRLSTNPKSSFHRNEALRCRGVGTAKVELYLEKP